MWRKKPKQKNDLLTDFWWYIFTFVSTVVLLDFLDTKISHLPKKMLPHNSLLTKWIIDETCVFFQTLDKVEWSDAGIYSCLAKEVGSDGLPTRQDIILDIYGKSTASSNVLLQF